ncbi:MAG: hypothetical protein HY340_02855 [Candidatus Kerfeldbacteria bacterium]|nr:hypothetical protein [Candidatus Kerfeldbacteria bacterium]
MLREGQSFSESHGSTSPDAEEISRRAEHTLSREVERWLKQAIIALPLVVGCGPERGIKHWLEWGDQQSIETSPASMKGAIKKPTFIETDDGTLLPRETKRAVDVVLASVSEPMIVAIDDRPTHAHDNHHTKEARAIGESPGFDERSTHRHSQEADLQRSASEHQHQPFSWQPVLAAREYKVGGQPHSHGDVRFDLPALGHEQGGGQHGTHEHHALLTQPGDHSDESVEPHSHVEIPILSGAGNVILGLEKRTDALSGEPDQHLELGVQGPFYAGLHPGAEVKFSDQGQEYFVTLQYAKDNFRVAGGLKVVGRDSHGHSGEEHGTEPNAEPNETAHEDEETGPTHHDPKHGRDSFLERVDIEGQTKFGGFGVHEGRIYVAPEVTLDHFKIGGALERDPQTKQTAAVFRISFQI